MGNAILEARYLFYFVLYTNTIFSHLTHYTLESAHHLKVVLWTPMAHHLTAAPNLDDFTSSSTLSTLYDIFRPIGLPLKETFVILFILLRLIKWDPLSTIDLKSGFCSRFYSQLLPILRRSSRTPLPCNTIPSPGAHTCLNKLLPLHSIGFRG